MAEETLGKKVFTNPKDLTLSNIREMIADGDIKPNPDYQRDYIYNDKQASKLIESFLIGIPIPTVYLCETEDESYDVIDGQQRLTSVARCLNNNFALTGLSSLPELNGKLFKDLDKPIQKKLKSSTINATVILKESQELKYEIFARLNQGSVSLRPQELRNCVYRVTFNTMLEEIANSNKQLKELFHDQNNRKSYQERILRFFALRNFPEYKSSMKNTMNYFMGRHQHDEDNSIAEFKTLFNSTIDAIKQVLGKDAFFMVDRKSKKFIEKFSGSVYDSIIIPFSFFSKNELMQHADEIREAIYNIKANDEQYKDYTYAATGSKIRVIGRITTIYNVLSSITRTDNNYNESRCFSEEIKKELFKPGCKCSYCGNEILSIDDAEVDHIIPFALGGKTDISNAQLLHRYCNRVKSDRTDTIVDSTDFEDEDEV